MMSKSDNALAHLRVWVEAMRQVPRLVDHTVGRCPDCGEERRRSECRQVERDECCLYACAACGATIDEGVRAVPF
jgi:hypothetical protein